MWLIFMTMLKQIVVGVMASGVVAAVVGYGSANYWGGQLEAKVTNFSDLDPRQMKTDIALNSQAIKKLNPDKMVTDVALNTQINLQQDSRMETFERMILNDRNEERKERSEQRKVAHEMLGHLTTISSNQSSQGARIGGLEVSVNNLRNDVREIRSTK